MKISIYLGVCLLFLISYTTYVKSECTNDCDNGCNSDCSSGCRTNCQTPCRRKCSNADCKSKCDIREPEEPEVQRTKETIIKPTKDTERHTSNVNDIKNDYKVYVNPNITLTNTVTNVNNITVPINVTSINLHNIRVSSSDSRSTQTNITTGGGQECSARNPSPNCIRNQKQIVLIPYPQRLTPQPQPRVIVQPVIREPIMVQTPQTPPPPPQRIPFIVPTPVIQPLPVPIQPQPTIVQRIPQYWYPRQPQQTVIAQPQRQVIYQQQQTPCGSPGGQCGIYCVNQPCSGHNPQLLPVPNPIPTTPCQSSDCASRVLYPFTNPYVPSNQDLLYGLNSFYSRNTVPQYGAIGSVDTRNGLSQMGALSDSRYGLQWSDMNRGYSNQWPIGLDSYFIPNESSRYQIQGANSTEVKETLSNPV